MSDSYIPTLSIHSSLSANAEAEARKPCESVHKTKRKAAETGVNQPSCRLLIPEVTYLLEATLKKPGNARLSQEVGTIITTEARKQ